MKTILTIIIAVAVATLVGAVAYRLSSDALAIIVGVVLGLAALIPTLVMVAILLRRGQTEPEPRPVQQPQPPVIVVSSGFPAQMMQQPQQAALPDPSQALIPAPPAQPPRKFRMMGYEATESVDLQDSEWAAY
ncbi:MAG TPA: hypothetical protein G4N94_02895 [Caldilineae bacterium]|nr:hypothetical protein [Caldilineae bacterium]